MKFCIKDFLSKCDQIRSFLRIWSHLLKKIVNEKLHFFVECSGSQKQMDKFFSISYLPLTTEKWFLKLFFRKGLVENFLLRKK